MLEIKHLSLTYGEAEKSLHDITFSVADGECALLTGKSGSGKSSIIRAINGIASVPNDSQCVSKSKDPFFQCGYDVGTRFLFREHRP